MFHTCLLAVGGWSHALDILTVIASDDLCKAAPRYLSVLSGGSRQASVRRLTPRRRAQYPRRTASPIAMMQTDIAAARAVSPAAAISSTATAASPVPRGTRTTTAGGRAH